MNSDRHLRAAVIGANGQDGRLLCRALLARSYEVLALTRQPSFTDKDILAGQPIRHATVDVAQRQQLRSALSEFRPDLIFHFAAVHGSSDDQNYEQNFSELMEVNTNSVHEILEMMRSELPKSGFIFASSSKVFGDELPSVVHEELPFRTDCLYALSKNASYHLIDYYRRHHGIRASVLFLFNHESELRSENFFMPKLLAGLAKVKSDEGEVVELASLDFHCDWGAAEEYMDISVDVAERGLGTDVIVATGHTITGRTLVEALCRRLAIDFDRQIMTYGSGEGQKMFRADNSKLKNLIGRVPERRALEVAEAILQQKYGITALAD